MNVKIHNSMKKEGKKLLIKLEKRIYQRLKPNLFLKHLPNKYNTEVTLYYIKY